MKRRQFLNTAVSISGLPFAPAVLAAPVTRPRSMTPSQYHLLTVVVGIIIPQTETLGAVQAEVPEFIDQTLMHWMNHAERQKFLSGFTLLAEVLDRQRFLQLTAAEQESVLARVDQQAFAAPLPGYAETYRQLKKLTLVGYYTSQQGQSAELNIIGPMAEMTFGPAGPPSGLTRYW